MAVKSCRAFFVAQNKKGMNQNDKYTGSVVLQKTVSFVGTQFTNGGELEQVLITNHHDAIISAADFEKAQQMKSERFRHKIVG